MPKTYFKCELSSEKFSFCQDSKFCCLIPCSRSSWSQRERTGYLTVSGSMRHNRTLTSAGVSSSYCNTTLLNFHFKKCWFFSLSDHENNCPTTAENRRPSCTVPRVLVLTLLFFSCQPRNNPSLLPHKGTCLMLMEKEMYHLLSHQCHILNTWLLPCWASI